MIVRTYNPRELGDAELRPIHTFANRILAERQPNEPPETFEQFAANTRNPPPIVEVTPWVVWSDDHSEVLGRAGLGVPLIEGNEHIVQFEIMVLPEQRRKGIGTALLGLVAGRTRSAGRTLLVSATTSTVPAGAQFMRAVGASAALEGHNNELHIQDIDRTLMRSWIERAKERADGFEMGWWLGRYPEDRLEDIAAMMEAQNTVPLGDLEVEDFHFSADHVRGMEATRVQRGVDCWTCYIEEMATGKIAGFTEILFHPSTPRKLDQGLTAVFEPYRNKGLGRWLKAAMMERVLDELPEAQVVVTGNADVNEAMLSINREMGFQPAMSETVWQMKLDEVESYLARKPAARDLLTPV